MIFEMSSILNFETNLEKSRNWYFTYDTMSRKKLVWSNIQPSVVQCNNKQKRKFKSILKYLNKNYFNVSPTDSYEWNLILFKAIKIYERVIWFYRVKLDVRHHKIDSRHGKCITRECIINIFLYFQIFQIVRFFKLLIE